MTQQTKTIQSTREDTQGYVMGDKRFFDHIITVEGVDYHFDTPKPLGDTFVAGKEATFTTEEKTMKNGKPRLKILPIKEQKPFNKPFSGGKNSNYSKDDAQITALSILSSLMTGYQQSSMVLDRAKIKAEFDFWYNEIKGKRGDFN